MKVSRAGRSASAATACRRHIPLFVAFFLFILFSNWSGLIPLIGKVEFLRAPTSDVNVTIGLALVVFFYFQYQGFRVLGVRTLRSASSSTSAGSRWALAARPDRPLRRPDRVHARVHQAGHAGNATLRQHLRRRGRARRDHGADDRRRSRRVPAARGAPELRPGPDLLDADAHVHDHCGRVPRRGGPRVKGAGGPLDAHPSTAASPAH